MLEILKLLPSGKFTIFIVIILFLFWAIDFFRASKIDKELEGSKQRLFRKIFKESIALLLVISISLAFTPTATIDKLWIMFIPLVITSILGAHLVHFPTSKFQLRINNKVLKVFKKIKIYRYTLAITHTATLCTFYYLFVSSITYELMSLVDASQQNTTFDIYRSLVHTNPIYFYFLLGLICLFYVVLRLYFSFVIPLVKESVNKTRVNVRLASGAILNGLFILESNNSKHLLLGDSRSTSESKRKYSIAKDKVEYIEFIDENRF
ncbi:hypothetical protein FE782_02010 [Paenibacillus antri]|uniref:Uncharacterized protein n=1 Tax=Paenibacillus antri TaxID=2582848 RepID=A0A5R9GLV6_9BACL|nr:hypothetical protein [Paenibacillus antri]TLS54143.1 hypothetical protein FE782_02010 [Paenibacillus antri]